MELTADRAESIRAMVKGNEQAEAALALIAFNALCWAVESAALGVAVIDQKAVWLSNGFRKRR